VIVASLKSVALVMRHIGSGGHSMSRTNTAMDLDRRFRRWSACGVSESVAVALAETMAEGGLYSVDCLISLPSSQ